MECFHKSLKSIGTLSVHPGHRLEKGKNIAAHRFILGDNYEASNIKKEFPFKAQ